METIQYSMTRRLFNKFTEKAWFLLALSPWRARAQECGPTNCPTSYFTCRGHRYCSGSGYFVSGCVLGGYIQGLGYCGPCSSDANYACYTQKQVVYASCYGVLVKNFWTQCCSNDCYFF